MAMPEEQLLAMMQNGGQPPQPDPTEPIPGMPTNPNAQPGMEGVPPEMMEEMMGANAFADDFEMGSGAPGPDDHLVAIQDMLLNYIDYAVEIRKDETLNHQIKSQVLVSMAQAVAGLAPLLKDDAQADLEMKQAEFELKTQEHEMDMQMKQAEMEFKQQENQMKLEFGQQQNQQKLQQQQEAHQVNLVQGQQSHETKIEQQKQAQQVKQTSKQDK